MNCRYCRAPLPKDSRESKQFCSASHKVMFSRKGALPTTTFTVTQSTEHLKPMPTAIPKKILKKPAIKSVSVEDDEDVMPSPKVLKKVAPSKHRFTGPRQWPTDITLAEVKNRLKGIRNYLEWATEQGLRGQIATRSWVEGLLAQAGQPASLADLVFGPKQKEEEVDDIP
jgi:hypothetical protein